MVTKISKRSLFYFLLVILPLLISLPVILYHSYYSQKVNKSFSQENILFQDNFNSNTTNWDYYKPAPGIWEWVATGGVEGGAFHHSYPDSGTWGHDDYAFLKNQSFTDFSFEAAIKITAGNAGIQGRVTIENPDANLPSLGGYRCDLFEGRSIKIQRYLLIQPHGEIGDHRNPLDLKAVDFRWEYGRWYNLKMEIAADTIRCYIDGVLKVEYTDTNSLTDCEKGEDPDDDTPEVNECASGLGRTQNGAIFKSGTVGFVANAANAYFDNVAVRSLGGGGETTPTPTSTLVPTGTVTPGPSNLTLSFKVAGGGLNPAGQTKIKVNLSAAGTGFTKDIILPDNGRVENVGLEGLAAGRAYDFILSSIGYLSQRKSFTLTSGRNPATGDLDFGALRPGDLKSDGQINGLDWSLMKLNYGQSGEE